MDTLLSSIHAHPTAWALGTFWVLSNAISAMPTPKGNGFYRWSFDFLHLLSANVARIMATRYPQTTDAAKTQAAEAGK